MSLQLFWRASFSIVLIFAVGHAVGDERDAGGGDNEKNVVELQQIRNATIKIAYGDTTFLIDPMLAPKGLYAAAPGALNNHIRNPTVDLPVPVGELIKVDAVIVTHLHIDHWDSVAQELLPKTLPIYVQNNADAEQIKSAGFINVHTLSKPVVFGDVTLSKTEGQHGSDEAMLVRGKLLGKVSGVILQRSGYKTVYVAGDTVWNRHVERAIKKYTPDVIVLNTGFVRFEDFKDAIIMGKEDVCRARRMAPDAQIIASHMEALGHSLQSRRELASYVSQRLGGLDQVLIPADGEKYRFGSSVE